MGNEPSEQDVKEFEEWPRAKQFDVGPFWSFCRGIIVYGIADEIPEFSDCLMKQIKELEERKNRKIRGEDKK